MKGHKNTTKYLFRYFDSDLAVFLFTKKYHFLKNWKKILDKEIAFIYVFLK